MYAHKVSSIMDLWFPDNNCLKKKSGISKIDAHSESEILLLTQDVDEKTEGVITKQFLLVQGKMPLP
jgi:hypothetical protein